MVGRYARMAGSLLSHPGRAWDPCQKDGGQVRGSVLGKNQ